MSGLVQLPGVRHGGRALHRTLVLVAALGLLLLGAPLAQAQQGPADAQVGDVMARPTAPAGVVFEVISSDEGRLADVAPAIGDYARRLRERFPGIEVAVVTHGAEQFSLLSESAGQYQALHTEIRSLIETRDVPVYVCGNHASWREKTASDFPDFVKVAPSAGGQLDHYQTRGFVLIVL